MRQVAITTNESTYYTYDTWGLLLAHVDFGFPSVKSSYVSIDGRDGSLDLTTTLDGIPHYENRQISATFKIINVPYTSYLGVASQVATALHGKKAELIFDADKGYKFVGRISIDEYDRKIDVGEISMQIECEPFKYPLMDLSDDWVWDTFDFCNGILDQSASGTVNHSNSSVTIDYEIVGMPVTPTLELVCESENISYRVVLYQKVGDSYTTICTISGDAPTTEEDVLDDDFKSSGILRLYLQITDSTDADIDYTFSAQQEGVL